MRAKKIGVLIRLFKSNEAQLLAKQRSLLVAIESTKKRKEEFVQAIQLECNATNVLEVLAYRERIRGLIHKAEQEQCSLRSSLADLEKQIKENYVEIKKCSLLQEQSQKRLLDEQNKAELSQLNELYQIRQIMCSSSGHL